MTYLLASLKLTIVTPFAGVWIEIGRQIDYQIAAGVTPFAGVWIEIILSLETVGEVKSPPSRGCGLKCL